MSEDVSAMCEVHELRRVRSEVVSRRHISDDASSSVFCNISLLTLLPSKAFCSESERLEKHQHEHVPKTKVLVNTVPVKRSQQKIQRA